MARAHLRTIRSARPLRRRSSRTSVGTTFSVLDVETTGLDVSSDRILEIAIVRMGGDGIVSDEYCTLAAAPVIGACAVHGITSARLVGAPTFAEIADEVRQRLSSGVVVAGHNVAFDLAFLTTEFDRIGIALPVAGYLCTMKLGELLGLEPARTNLARACGHRGIPIGGRHSALGDARATAALLASYLRHAERGRAQRRSAQAAA